MTRRKTARASEIVFWVSFAFLLEGTRSQIKLDVMHRVDFGA